MARLGLVGGHAAAHVAKPDKGDAFRHSGHLAGCVGCRAQVEASTPRPAGSGAKISSSSVSVTSSRLGGFHFGALSLSTITARTPSRKSCRCTTRGADPVFHAPCCRRRAALRAPSSQLAEGDLQGLRRLGRRDAPSWSRAQSRRRPPAPRRSPRRCRRRTGGRSRPGAGRDRRGGPASPSNSVSRVSIRPGSATIARLQLGEPGARHDSRWRCRGSRQSAALIRAPVSASHSPMWSGIRGRNQPPPTSGKRPMPVSGMAKVVRSVATRKRQGRESPRRRPW